MNLAGALRRAQGVPAAIRYGDLSAGARGEELPFGSLGWLDMVQWTLTRFSGRRLARIAAVLTGAVIAAAVIGTARAQPPPFQIVWVVIGEASSASDTEPAHAGRQLFMASDLVSRSLANVRVEQVEVVPTIHELAVGQRLCVTQMGIRTIGPGKEPVQGAPLSISVRQDHKHQLGLNRSKRDICLRPSEAGEYPLRLTSMLPAGDGTTRGAQVYIRVSDPNKTEAPAPNDIP